MSSGLREEYRPARMYERLTFDAIIAFLSGLTETSASQDLAHGTMQRQETMFEWEGRREVGSRGRLVLFAFAT